VSETATDPAGELILQGIGVSPGVAIGEVVVFAREGAVVPDRVISEKDVPVEIARFEEALIKTRHQIAEIQSKVSSMLGEEHASIFDAHLLVVDDRYFVEEVIRGLREQRRNVEAGKDGSNGSAGKSLYRCRTRFFAIRHGRNEPRNCYGSGC
jgi:phosphotransferase system enzyme I (PtsI)